jgi:transposase
MMPTTRSQKSKSPPRTPTRSPIKRKELSTNRKYRFFLKHEEAAGIASFASICRDVKITTPCGRKWLKKRDELGDLAWNKTRKLSKKLGGPQHATKEEIQALVDPTRNPARNQPLEAQIDFL